MAMSIRLSVVRLYQQLLTGGGSISRLLPDALVTVDQSERAQLHAWVHDFARWHDEVAGVLDQLLDKPLKAKDLDVTLLMRLGIYQLRHGNIAAHAAVNETVKITKQLGKPWARGLVNAVLRGYQRREEELMANLSEAATVSHPDWLLEQLKDDWPDRWQDIVRQNNTQGPMTLRVNTQRASVDEYRSKLEALGMLAVTHAQAKAALTLASAVNVDKLPGFHQGDVSVQDAAAQLAMNFFQRHTEKQGRLLDACAAPGGKTAHALESDWFREVVALDLDPLRLERVAETIKRLQLGDKALQLAAADAGELAQWWNQEPFDAILLDAPCTGSGVIRRHPDIKVLRRADDVTALADRQSTLLDALWQTLKPGGLLVYATCSVLKQENRTQVQEFLARTDDACLCEDMLEILPGEQGMDGFFYACLQRRLNDAVA